MSFFNLRRSGNSSKLTASLSAPAESLEIVRKRAKHRLIGSAVLVLLGVIGFPLLFDTQPRPVSVGIPIEIPSKQGAKPLSLPAAAEREVMAVAPTPAALAAPAGQPASDAARANALLNGTGPAVASVSTAAASAATPEAIEPRWVVQVGAFAEAAKAREARLKLENAGLKTYTQVAETKDGKRIRVRVGPFAAKAEADKIAKQIKALDLPAAILTL